MLSASGPESSLNVLQHVCEGLGRSRTPVESLFAKYVKIIYKLKIENENEFIFQLMEVTEQEERQRNYCNRQ